MADDIGYCLPLHEYVDDGDFELNPDGTPRTPGKDIEHLIVNASKKMSHVKLEDEFNPALPPESTPSCSSAPHPAQAPKDDAVFAVPKPPRKYTKPAAAHADTAAAKKSVGRPRKTSTVQKPLKTSRVMKPRVAEGASTAAATWEQLIGPFETPFVSPRVKANNIVRRQRQQAAEAPIKMKIKKECPELEEDPEIVIKTEPMDDYGGGGRAAMPFYEWYDPGKLIKEEFPTASLRGLIPGLTELTELSAGVPGCSKNLPEVKIEPGIATSDVEEKTLQESSKYGKSKGPDRKPNKSYSKEEPRSKFFREVAMGNGRLVRATFIAPRGVRFPDEVNTAEIEEWHENYPKHMGGKTMGKSKSKKNK